MHLVVLIIAIALIGVTSSQFLVAGARAHQIGHRVLLRRQRSLKRRRSEARIARLSSELAVKGVPSDGSTWRVMEVAKVVDESTDAKSFYLTDPYRQPLPAFHPGQYLMVRPALAGAYQTTRCYSLSISPNPNYWRITVKRQAGEHPPRADRKTGALSVWLHENIRAGDCLLIGGPGGQFFLPPENTSPLVLLAAGVGITPMNSMLQHSMTVTPNRPISLYYQAKDLQHWPLGREVHACAGRTRWCRVITYLSRSDTPDLQSSSKFPGEFRSGRMDAHHIVHEVAASDAHFFLCGPDPWMEQFRKELSEAGVPEAQIHWESFGSFSGTPTNSKECSTAHGVQFLRSNINTRWNSQNQSLWELARSHDVSIPSGCLSGVCGSCRVKVLKGTVDYARKVQLSLAENECLACVARPTQDVVIDA